MDDGSWVELREPHERLRWARARSVFKTAEAAAESLGMKGGTYRAYERAPDASKHISMEHQAAVRFGRKFKVSWVWLLTGEGTPYEGQLTEAEEKVLEALRSHAPEDQAQAADAIVTLLRKAG